ncbi:hypothetical protein CSOJ01_15346 [Colletotrichum sojae]|uniref:Uncharacterized protein n=1 Tax=Colletotrichum sojae TaxID=2175907 RepID=A0A8H6ING0_9PEZI|nr:hypothetical protein CSOJ01_15346 [Colletotrichum sojae]
MEVNLQHLFSVATSDWGKDHLKQCRVKVSDVKDLPTLVASEKPVLSQREREELDKLANGPTTSDDPSEYGFVTKYGPSLGPVWAALHRLTTASSSRVPGLSEASFFHEIPSSPPGPDLDSDLDPGHNSEPSLPSPYRPGCRPPPRSAPRRPDPNMVLSTRMRVASSSSSPLPSSQRTDHSAYIESSESRRSPHLTEDLTVHLISTFIRHVLYNTNDSAGKVRVDFDDLKRSLKATVVDGVEYTSIDDGGLRVTHGEVDGGRIAILETKSQLGPVDNGVSRLPDRRVAQIVGEALASRLVVNRHSDDRTVFVITAARYFVCFLEFRITREYLEKWESRVQENNPDIDIPTLDVHHTRWLDLRDKGDRNKAIGNIAALTVVAKTFVMQNQEGDEWMVRPPG